MTIQFQHLQYSLYVITRADRYMYCLYVMNNLDRPGPKNVYFLFILT